MFFRGKTKEILTDQPLHPARKPSKKLFQCLLGLFVCVGLCLILLSGIRNHFLQENHTVLPPLVKALTIHETDDISKYSYPGEVCSKYESQLAFQVGGKILKKHVDVGDVVQQGDVLLSIDAKDFEQAANINAAAVESAQSKYQLTKTNLERTTLLYEEGNQANASHSQSANQLSYCNLYADKSGIVANVDVEEGQVVTAGQKVITIVQSNSLEVNINIPENKIEIMKNSQDIDVSFWALPDVAVKGAISEISPIADSCCLDDCRK